ncbi:MAG: Gfo/Idh/MocA family oxidoreductase [Phycisphaerae bacterium]|nr:Gfo/Idh/MocA family oxidoreductase [Phycisphaerae bacterium]
MKRRDFIKSSLMAGGVIALPSFIPASVLADKPNDKINIAQIGVGRIALTHDMPETIKNIDMCRIVAVADVDMNRANYGKKWIEDYYKKKTGKDNFVEAKAYQDYREMLKDKSIDAVIISTPDHWHSQPAIEAALAGKDIYLQKPASLTIHEGRMMSDIVHRTGRIFQIGSQQRSAGMPQFRRVCELVRNGRIGQVKHIQVGIGTDPGCGIEKEMPVPANLNYDMWLGSTPHIYYTEKRVHPQKGYDRPGWLRCEQFGAGMITGWGAHHLDTAHWGMGTEFTGPIEIEGKAKFPESGLWDVHGDFDVHAKYANGVTMHISSSFTNGVRFEGTDGWIFVSRGNAKVTSSDPVQRGKAASQSVSDPKILESVIGPDEIHLEVSPEHHLNWLQSLKSRKQPIAPVEVAHRSCSACLLSHISMKMPGVKLKWNPKTEKFVGNDKANGMLTRPQRYPYGVDNIKM